VTATWRVPALLVLGTLLMQAAWWLALPPFRGTDEFDHAYRAAAVAGGQWRSPGEQAAHGRGELVTVPRSLVTAARPVCSSYAYTGHDNCNPAGDAAHGRVQVASAAATYQPVFYWVVGSVASSFSGAGALYAMRVATAVLCAVLVGLAAWVTSRWSRSLWPCAGLVVAASPVVVFSTSVVAPNGLEMCAALLLWLSLLGLHSIDGVARHQRALLVCATVGAVVLTTLRSIGPLWLGLIVLTILLPLGPRRIVDLVRRTPVLAGVSTALVLAATLASVWWTRSAGTNALEPFDTDVTNRWTATLGQVPLWLLQSIAAFPRRGDPAPAIVYLGVALVFASLLVAGFLLGTRRWRVTLSASAVVALAVPLVLTVLTIAVSGPVWQGRYGLPYAFGLALVAAAALDAARASQRPPWLLAGWLLLLVAQVLSVIHVAQVEHRSSPLADSPDWVSAPTLVIGLLSAAGFTLWGAALIVAARGADARLQPDRSDSLAP
jgi:hypothetical protein